MDFICGINPVLEALSAGRRHFDRLLVVKGLRNRRVSEAITRASQLGVALRFETREALDRLAGGTPHQGIIAVVSPTPAIALSDLLATAHDPALLVVLDGIEDPRNLGAIVRTVEAAGADGVLLPERHSAGLSETVNRASAGALEHVKVARIGNVSQALDSLKERGIWVIGLDATGERWDKIDFRRPVALVLGGEGRGIRRLVREHCDQVAALPLFGHVSSLNVSVAAGAVLYEVIRQRGAIPSHVRPIPPQVRPHSQITGPALDDTERDPGWIGPPAEAGEAMGEEDDLLPGSLSVVQIHEGEDAAWRLPAEGPPADRRGMSRHHSEPKAPGAGGPPRSSERSSERPAEGERGDRGGQGPRGRKRRRRRGGRGPDGPRPGRGDALPQATAGETAPKVSSGEAVSPTNEGAPPSPNNGNGSSDPARRRGRRRRRRRH
jgi:23S rRNA (guanosine2251-2'-O)-methyltransferase